MCLEPLRIRVALVGPARAQQRLAIDDLTRTRDERREQSEFRRREVERLSVDGRPMAPTVDREPADLRGRAGARGCRSAPQQRPYARGELLPTERLLQVVVRSDIEQARMLLGALLSGEHQDRRVRALADLVADLIARHPRQPAVEDHQVGMLVGVPLERRLAVVRGDDLIAVLPQQRADHADHRGLVVDHEDGGHALASRAAGMLKAKVAPPSALSSYQMSPPCASITRRDEKSPIPVPGTSLWSPRA